MGMVLITALNFKVYKAIKAEFALGKTVESSIKGAYKKTLWGMVDIYAVLGLGAAALLIGTAGFAAPEQYGFSASTVQTDIYSLGVLLNTLRTGALPSERRAGGQLRRIIDRCLQLYPKDRYPGVEDLARALKAAKFERIPWLPPGFRTQCWYKAIPATFYYIFIYAFCFVEYRTPDHPLYQPLSDRLQWAAIALFPVAFYCNYLGIQRLFPLMKSRNRLLRFLGLLIGPLWAVAVSAIAAVMLSPF
jgi:hypothetical protein